MTGRILKWCGFLSLILIILTIILVVRNMGEADKSNAIVMDSKERIIIIEKTLSDNTPLIAFVPEIEKKLREDIVNLRLELAACNNARYKENR